MIVCQECQKPVYKKFEYRCFTCKPLRPSTAEKKESTLKKTVLLHACHTPKKEPIIQNHNTENYPKYAAHEKTVTALRAHRAPDCPDSHPVVKLWEKQDLTLATAEKNHIIRILDLCHGNKTHAANLLGISVKTLYNKLVEWGLYLTHEGMVQ